MAFEIEDSTSIDLPRLLEINQEAMPAVSHLTVDTLQALADQAIYFRKAVDGVKIAGFVLALDENASYQSQNFQWFKKRYRNFFYIDRIIIAPNYQRRGIGRLLYQDIDRTAKSKAFDWITCEVNLRPPNPESVAYHQALGFKAVGEQDTEGGKKRVSMLAKGSG